MIQDFLASWELFHNSYLEGWLIALALSLVGVFVIARDQIFVGAAISQASTVGIAVALLIPDLLGMSESAAFSGGGSWLQSDAFQASMAVAFAIAAAMVTAWGGRMRRESHEAVSGWVFLLSASLSVLLMSHSPHGLEEINRIHSSSLIGATETDLWVFGGLAAVTVAIVALTKRRLLLFALDPSMAAAVGMKTRLWSVGVTLWLGLAVGLSIRCSGMLYTFGMLVLPALVAKNVCRELRPMLLVAPLVALVTALVGFVLSDYFDFPPAQMIVALLGLLLPVSWAVAALRGRT